MHARMQETKEAPTARVRTRVKPLVGAATEAAERHAGAVADRVVANLGTGSPVAGVAQTKIRRLTTTSQSLGDTGTVGKAKAVVGKSNYVNIKKELTKAQAAAPAAQAKHLNRILRLIQAWMKQNEAGTSKGNLARKAKLEALRTEVTAALAAPPARPAAAAPMTALAPAAAHSARSAPAPARPKTAAPAGAKGKAAKPAGAPARPKTPTPAKAMAPAAGTGWKAAKPTAPTPAPPAPDVFSRISIALDDIIGIGDDGRFDTKQLDDYTAADMPPLPAVPAKAKPAVSTPAVAPAPAPATAWVAFPAPAKRGAPTPAAAPTPALAPTPAIATPAAVLATPAPAPAPAAVPAAAPVVAPPVADPARVQHLADELAAFAMCIDGEPSVAMRVMFLGTVRDDLDELEPLLTDPGLKKTHKAVVDLSRALLANLPLWEEQAEYLRDLKGGQDKFAFLTGLGVKAIADAVSLAAAAATPGTAFPGGLGMGPLALQLMRDRKITDAEMAAIKLYTAPEYKYMTVGMEKRAAQFRPKDADNPAGDPGALGWLKGAIGGLEDEAEVGAANAPRSAKQMNINPKTGKAWTPEQLKKKGRHRNDEVLGAALQPGEFGPLSPADTAADEGQRHTKMAMAGLEKLEKVSGIETYRGMSLPKVAFERDYKEGGSWQTKALVSTSRRDVKAIQFVRIAKGEVKFLIKFKVEDGRDVDVISVNQGEYEVLLLPGATGTITKIEPEAPPRNYKIVHIQQDP